MRIDSEAIVCAVRNHGEHGTVVRLLTPEHGLVAAYVRGGRGRRMRPALIPGNLVSAQFRARTEVQLPQAAVELSRSRAALLAEPLAAAAIEWVTALVASALPERQSYPPVHEGLAGLLDAIEAAPSARGWASALARFELLLLAELGYGRDASGLSDLIGEGRSSSWPQLLESLEHSGDDLFRDLLPDRARSLHDCRGRLVERLRRVAA